MTQAASFAAAVCAHQQGRLDDAQRIYCEILCAVPNHAAALHLLGVIHHQRGDHEDALRLIARAIALNPNKAVYHNNYGAALQSLARYDEALASFRRALEIHPHYADALANLGMAQESLGQDEEALRSLRQAGEIAPQHGDALNRLAGLLQKRGQTEHAAELWRQALAVRPDDGTAHFNLGNALQEMHCIDEARRHFDRAAELRPEKTLWRFRAAAVCAAVFQSKEEIDTYRKRLAGALDEWHAMISTTEARRTRRDSNPQPLFPNPQSLYDDLFEAGAIPSFNLAYHGRDSRRLKEEFAAIYEPYFVSGTGHPLAGRVPLERDGAGTRRVPEAQQAYAADPADGDPQAGTPVPETGTTWTGTRRVPTTAAPSGTRSVPDTLRIGFVVTRGHEGIFLRCMSGIIAQLAPERFEPVVLCSRAIAETVRKGIPRADLRIVPFPDSLSRAVECVREVRCDLLYHWEVGTDPMNYFLPFAVRHTGAAQNDRHTECAGYNPVQCTSWGSAITSGVPAVDYFLSSQWMETAGSDEQYTEKLWRAKTLLANVPRLVGPKGTVRPHPQPLSQKGRGEFLEASRKGGGESLFGLPEGRHLYVCPQNPMKLHPDFDPLLEGILRADSRGVVALAAARHQRIVALLRQRFATRIPAVADRIVFVPRQTFAGYCRLLQLADVILDPPHYGAGSSCYDIFSFNQPVVVLPGELIIGRVTQACYRKMGFEELIAATPEEYVRIAVRMATDRDYRAYAKDRIAWSSSVLFDDLEAVREHERFFEEACRQLATP